MGRDWYWSRTARKASASGNGGGGGGADHHHHHHHQVAGCMSGVFHLFDLHHLLFTTRNAVVVADPVPSTSPANKKETLKGVEAPRNSLELDVAATTSSPSAASAFAASTDGYEIPFGIQVVPRRTSSLQEQMEEERSHRGLSTARSSSGTGNVVAKLMGLDALPDGRSLSSFSPTTFRYREESLQSPPVMGKQRGRTNDSKKHQKKMVDGSPTRGPMPRHVLQPRNSNVMVEDDARHGTRSLPETPRMSSARWSWDSDPRLSVQSNCSTAGTGIYYNNKENVNVVNNSMSASAMQELKCIFEDRYSQLSASPPLFRTTKAKPRAREESGRKQQSNNNVEESKSSPSEYAREMVRQVKGTASRRIERGRAAAKASETLSMTNKATTQTATPPSSSCSTPRLVQVVEDESAGYKEQAPTPPKQPSPPPPTSPKSSSTTLKPEKSSSPTPPAKCKKLSCDRFNERLKKPTSAAPETSNAISVSSVLPHWKSKRTNRPRQQTQPPLPLQIDIQVAKPLLPKKGRDGSGGSKPPPVPEELHYVKRVLDKAGIRGHTLLPFAVRWNSPSNPLDPIIFHQMELSHAIHDGPLRHRCNRKLLFDLVDEILGDLLYPYLSDNSRWRRRTSTAKPTYVLDGESVLRRLWSRIRSFPAADCQVMQDIDSLVESDIPTSNIRRLLRHPAVEEEVGTIAAEMERWLVDALLEENVSPFSTWHGRRHLT